MRDSLRDTRTIADYLKQVYAARHMKNSAYSYRAFSRDLGISVSHLSDVLRGRNGLSRRAVYRMCRALDLDARETEYFWSLSESMFARSAEKRAAALERLKAFREAEDVKTVALESFSKIADWYHFGFLEASRLAHPPLTPEDYAKVFNLDVERAGSALELLVEGGLMKKEGSRFLSSGHFIVPGGIKSEAIRRFHGGLLDLAKRSVTEQSLDQRFLSSNVNAVRRSDVPRARAMIQDFVERFNREFGMTDGNDAVCALSVQYFELAKPSDYLGSSHEI